MTGRSRTSLSTVRIGVLAAFATVAGAQTSQLTPAPVLQAAKVRPAADSHAASAPARFHITGIVVDAVSGAPVRRCQLTVSPMSARRSARGAFGSSGSFATSSQRTAQSGRRNGQPEAATTTDSAGRFDIDLPTAGGWRLEATARSYRVQAYEEHNGYSSAVIVTEQQPMVNLVFNLVPAGSIQGYVLDEAGEAVRDAQISVALLPAATPDQQHPRPQMRGAARADDRGHFDLFGLQPGTYVVRVQAQPWYSTSAPGGQQFGMQNVVPTGAAEANGPDPLDVVYPVVWYPGATDPSAATPVTLRAGEVHEVDFHLQPVPGVHLRIPADGSTVSDNSGQSMVRIRSFASVTQILPDGTEAGIPLQTHTDAAGNLEIAGLAPGEYRLQRQPWQTADQADNSATFHIGSDSPRFIDAAQGTRSAPVTITFDPDTLAESLQVSFRDLSNGHVISAQRPSESHLLGLHRGADGVETVDAASEPAQSAPVALLQPGRYEVTLNGPGDTYLTGIAASGASAVGRTVTVGSTAASLLLHLGGGRAKLTGFVRLHGQPDVGAMVLLVPATLGDPAGLGLTRRDQSNSDGSFDIEAVLPGAYILVAIDHGWDVDWNDASKLRGLLMHGVPLKIDQRADLKETIDAVTPETVAAANR